MTARPRVHVLTGAGSGIGLAVADRLAARGDRLIMLVRNEQRIDELARRVPSYDRIHPVDLADSKAVEAFASEFLTGKPEVAAVDSLIHCAGVVDLAPVESFDLGRWQEQLAVNLTAPAILTRALLSRIRVARGTVVFVNSSAGLNANPHWAAYAASKSGLRALADSLRAEEVEHGVRVTSVFPSRTATPMQEKVHEQEGKVYAPTDWIQPGTVAETILHVLDLPLDATIPELTVRPAG